MKNEDSFLGIFQDPLLMLIALILLWTLPIIIPRETSPSPQTYETQVKIEKLRKDIEDLDLKIEKLYIELQRLKEDFNELEKIMSEKKAEANKQLNQLKQRIFAIKRIIEKKTKELQSLEQRLEEEKKRAEGTKVVKELEQRINSLKEKIQEKKDLLKGLEQKLKKVKETKQKIDIKIKERKNNIAFLSQKIDIEEDKIESLKQEKKDLEDMLRGGGIGEYTKEAVAEKDQVVFEAFKNRLVAVNEDNYHIKVFREIYKGHIVKVARLTKKNSVSGESIETITKENSKFKTKLDKLDPEKDYIFFGLQKDSFEIFLKARQIAWEKGLVVSWRPWDEGPIYAGPGGEKGYGR